MPGKLTAQNGKEVSRQQDVDLTMWRLFSTLKAALQEEPCSRGFRQVGSRSSVPEHSARQLSDEKRCAQETPCSVALPAPQPLPPFSLPIGECLHPVQSHRRDAEGNPPYPHHGKSDQAVVKGGVAPISPNGLKLHVISKPTPTDLRVGSG